MSRLGNAWHIPANMEATNFTMRNPVFPTASDNQVVIYSGNQFRGNEGANQNQNGSAVMYKRSNDTNWQEAGMQFDSEIANNKYFRANIPLDKFAAGDQILYYLVLAYSDRDITFMGVDDRDITGWTSGTFDKPKKAQDRPFTFTVGNKNEQKPFNYIGGDSNVRGQWSEVFKLPSVGAHASLLPTGKDAGKVLMWGRRDKPTQSLNTFPANPHTPNGEPRAPSTCTPFILDPKKKTWRYTKQPFMPGGAKRNPNLPPNEGSTQKNANLFCSGHTFRHDGRLLVVGGHYVDSKGLDQACLYDPEKDVWEATPCTANGTVMGNGRWYPTVLALPTGESLVTGGSYEADSGNVVQNPFTQQYSIDISSFDAKAQFSYIGPANEFDLYPCMHVASSGYIYWISRSDIRYLDQTTEDGRKLWQLLTAKQIRKVYPEMRVGRDYAPSVMYDKDKVIFMGGGSPPTAFTEILDLSDPNTIVLENPGNMLFPRRQHNATVLPDGSVLVTGGTRGNSQPGIKYEWNTRFNDLRPSYPVHIPELWDPKSKTWTAMASEQIDRCYHAAAVLLPDGRVLSTGGGEFQLDEDGGQKRANDEEDTQRNAQIFSPPYLFKGPQPKIDSISPASKIIECGKMFDVVTANPNDIAKVNLIAPSSVTHSLNTSQRLVPLGFEVKGRNLTVRAPPNARSCPPGYYMLFIINKLGVPSVAEFVKIVPTAEAKARHTQITKQVMANSFIPPDLNEQRAKIRAIPNTTRIEIGLTASCPYGLSACWGFASEALSKLSGVEHVDPIAHGSGSTASVFLLDNTLPNLNLWTEELKALVRDTYGLRGYEAAVVGKVEARDGSLYLVADDSRPEVPLISLKAGTKIQRDGGTGGPQDATAKELSACATLGEEMAGNDGLVRITGPVNMEASGHTIQVRSFEWL